jgi:multidrug efflux pump subunit AcrA (membrane-fusion protein)
MVLDSPSFPIEHVPLAQTAAQAAAQARAEAQQAAQAARAEAQEAAAEARAEAQRAVREAQQEVEQARLEAEQARREAEQAIREVQREARDAMREARVGQPPWARDFPPGGPQVPEGAIVISIAFFVMCAVIAIGIPIARAFARRMDKRAAAPSGDNDTQMRLERIEHAVDAIALEVERISEGQRFTSKVLSEMRALPEPDPAEALGAPMLRARERR